MPMWKVKIMTEREREINFALNFIIETLNTFQLAIGAKHKDGITYPIIIDGKDGKEYAVKKDGE